MVVQNVMSKGVGTRRCMKFRLQTYFLSDYNTKSSDYQVQFTFKLPHTDSPLTDSFPSCQCSCIVNACTDLQEMLGSHRPKINGIINSNAYLKRWFNFPQRKKL